MDRQTLGQSGERQVAAYLERQGFTILARNARAGRLEIDLVARRRGLLVFCEVRARASRSLLEPIETVDYAKITRVRRAAAQWLDVHPQPVEQIRFDAAQVVFDRDPPQLAYFEAAF
jgi:putative endonuclease